ncbi:MAG: NADPH-dependent glutamate synthase [Syntrophales bacterium]|jgi:glutamate synthase (NADPH/NADH) small chain|nr:NADPH-dependent glutamate synthase [Syntrophales bacterium]NLN59341.1 NADPH-dependent glutamate synthase [Deltaproteobacteria bacterium]
MMEEKAQTEKINRQKMPEQNVSSRIRNFTEVPLGYDPRAARREASRCIMCKNPKCVDGCPVGIDIPAFIKLIKEGKFLEAIYKIKEKNSLPAVCGRVCPQEDQCEKMCILGLKGEPVGIGNLERFAADYEYTQPLAEAKNPAKLTGKKVAVVGSGPSGLTVAADLALLGHDVTIFEALHESGGVLIYGIPEFRLPKAIVKREVDYLRSLGVKIYTDMIIGKLFTVDELFERGFEAVYLGVGAGLPVFMGIPGENLNGILSANEFLTRVNLMKGYEFPDADTPVYVGNQVAVIGGGNVAMDCARTALRLGAKMVTVLYRRSRREMPARLDEVIRAEEEGIIFHYLTNPIRYLANEQNWVKGIECIRMELTEPDDSGRRNVIPIAGSEQILDFDTVVVAVGAGANPVLSSTTPDLKLNSKGYYIVDPVTGLTSKPRVFAGGDIVTGSATVISAMGAGRESAQAIHKLIMGIKDAPET